MNADPKTKSTHLFVFLFNSFSNKGAYQSWM